ncbi:glycosyl hydrolase family 8 [Bacillus sp. NPDC077027]|uniref:glycosyl hydrolase family 8 n=1 Tax=Bacillus sp. NPDC077027 TaxID=3390548 RepID=UPI003D018FF4
MKKTIQRAIVITFIAFVLGGCTLKKNDTTSSPEKDQPLLPAEDFITHHLLTEQGLIRTTFANPPIYLSESLGLWMDYLIRKKDQSSFDKQINLIKKHFLLEDQLLTWKIANDKKSNVNALIDDLRVVHALNQADEMWQKSDYRNLALEIARALKEKSMYKGIFTDYYDVSAKQTSQSITLSYIDPNAISDLNTLGVINDKTLSRQLSIIQQAPRKNDFFPKSYDIDAAHYSFDADLNLIDQLYTALHAADMKVDTASFMTWLQQTFKKEGKLFGRYHLTSKEPSVTFESPAVYALSMLYALKMDQPAFALDIYQRMKQLEIQDPLKPYYGGYLNEKETHSFDNLLPLIAERELLNEAIIQ